MLAYLAQRLGQSIVVLFLVSIVSFVLILLSGDPVAMMLPTHASEQDRISIRHELGLDRPLTEQYATFAGRALHGDFGTSIKFDQPVGPLILSKFPATLLLACTAIVLAIAIGLPLGITSATRPGTWMDFAGTALALATAAVPTFWIGLILILVVSDALRLLPSGGSGDVQHLILPAVTLAAPSVGLITRLTRASVLAELEQPYVRTAHAKGLAPLGIQYGHVLRNALIPIVTVVALQFGALLGGSVIVETVFSWPGAGWLLMQGVFARDVPVVRALVLILGASFVLLNLMVDISYRYIDPRIRSV